MSKINKVFAIQCYGPSGTTLLHSLMDEHPEIISMPLLYPIPIYYLWDEYLDGKDKTSELIKKTIKENLPVLFEPNNAGGDPSLLRMGENEDKIIKVDQENFFSNLDNYFSNIRDITRKDFLLGIYIAYNKCYRRDLDKIKYLCFPLHDQPKKHAEYLRNDFNDVKILHVIRNPVKSIASIIKHINSNQQKFSLFKSLIHSAVSNITLELREHWEEKNYRVYGKTPYLQDDSIVQSRYIRLEDIHLNREKVMKKITHWLNIRNNPVLSRSTFMGLLWHNRSESIKVSGTSKKIISQKQNKYINIIDEFRLKLLCRNELEYFRYYKFNFLDKFNICFILPILIFLPFKCDFNFVRLKYRLSAMQRNFSNKETPVHLKFFTKRDKNIDHFLAMLEWVLLNHVNNILQENELIKYKNQTGLKLIDVGVFIFTFPFFILRLILNYFLFRFALLKIWVKLIFLKEEISLISLE